MLATNCFQYMSFPHQFISKKRIFIEKRKKTSQKLPNAFNSIVLVFSFWPIKKGQNVQLMDLPQVSWFNLGQDGSLLDVFMIIDDIINHRMAKCTKFFFGSHFLFFFFWNNNEVSTIGSKRAENHIRRKCQCNQLNFQFEKCEI